MTRANDTDFGLGGSVRPRPSPLSALAGRCCGAERCVLQVWTNDLEKGEEIAAQIQSGVRGVNAHPGGAPDRTTVFGGVKQSGLGVEGGGQIGLKEFTDVTTLRIAKTGVTG